MDKQIKIHDYLDIKSKDYYIGIKTSGDHTQAVESLSGDSETPGTDFPRWGDHCPILLDTSQNFRRHLIIPSGQQKATGWMWSGDFKVGRCFLLSGLWIPPGGEKEYREEMNSTSGNEIPIFLIQFSNQVQLNPS